MSEQPENLDNPATVGGDLDDVVAPQPGESFQQQEPEQPATPGNGNPDDAVAVDVVGEPVVEPDSDEDDEDGAADDDAEDDGEAEPDDAPGEH